VNPDEEAVKALEDVFIEEIESWVRAGELNYRRIRDARGLMLDHLRRARQEGPL